MIFSTVLHPVRKRFGISCNEYCVADMIFVLSSNPRAPIPGWCNASKQTLGDIMDMSRQSIITIIQKLEGKGLVERNASDHLRTTQLWYDAVSGCQVSLHPVKKLDTPPCKETLQDAVKKLNTDIYKEIYDEVDDKGEKRKIDFAQTLTSNAPPVAPPPPMADPGDNLIDILTSHEERLVADQEFISRTARALGVKTTTGENDTQKIVNLICRFFAEQIATGSQRARIWSEAKKYCYNWIRIQIEKQLTHEPTSNNPRQQQSTRNNYARPSKSIAITTDDELLNYLQNG
ncbi:MarR family transcriptional regulator [Larkinella arboricola]